MKRKMNRKLILLIVAILVVGSSTVFAAPNNLTTLKGWFGDIKIFSNGNQVQLDTKPLVINNTTYVPVRALTNVLNKDIQWDQNSFSIYITDKPDANYNYVMMQLFEKQDEITKLQAKVKELEAQLAAKETKISSLSDMQKYLNKEYGTYEKVDFDIVLSGSTSKVTAKIYIDDTKTNDSNWNKLYKSDIEKYVKNIVDDIQREFKNAGVTGYIENDYTGKTVVDFYTNTSGKLIIDTDYRGSSSGSVYDLYDMEEFLNDEYYKYDGINFDFSLSGTTKSIRVNIKVNSDDWYYYRSQEKFLEYVYDDIIYYFPNAEVYGYVDDYYFDFDSKGNVYLR